MDTLAARPTDDVLIDAPSGSQISTARAAREAIYKAALYKTLATSRPAELDFFVNARRFELMQAAIGSRLAQRPIRILNAACGPFAFEFYGPVAGATIDSFDIDKRIGPLHKALTNRSLIAPCTFKCIDVAAFKASATYDVVLVNDLFYSKHVDFYAVIGAFAASVAPGGVLYFDIQDERAAPLWAALGKGGKTRRYNLANISKTLEALGFIVESVTPALGIKSGGITGGIDGLARRLLWRKFGIANNFAFVARR